MKKKLLIGIFVLSARALMGADAGPGTEAVIGQALAESASGGSGTATFKTVMRAANRYGDAQVFVSLARRVGLQYALNNYNGKKKVKSKKMKKYLSLIPVGQKITVLAPIGSALSSLANKLRAAEDTGNKTARAAALKEIETVLKAHILKGEFTRATLKGQVETIGGTKINADNLQYFKADIKALNGFFHLIKRLSTDTPPAEKTAQPMADQPADKAAEKPVAKPVESPTDKPADKPAAKPAEASSEKASEKVASAAAEKPEEKAAEKAPEEKAAPAAGDKPADKSVAKPAEKSIEKAADKPVEKATEVPAA